MIRKTIKGKYISRILKFFIIICVCIDFGGCGRESNYDDINILYHADDGEYIEVRDAWSVVANETLETARQKGKTILTFVTSSVKGYDSQFRRVVDQFNNQDEKYYVDLVNCFYGDELVNMQTRISMEISTGKGPDILTYDVYQMDNETLDKNVVVDLSWYLEQSGVTKEAFFPSYASLTYKDKIYGVTVCGDVLSYGIKEEVLGNKEQPKLEVLLDKLLEYPGDASFMWPQESPYVILKYFLDSSESILGAINWENKTCDFTTPSFSKVLDIAKRYSEDAQKGCEPIMCLYSLDMGGLGRQDFGNDGYVMLGYPFDDGYFPRFTGNDIIMINANTSCLEGSYAFVSFLMSKTGQSFWTEPVNKEIWNEVYQENEKDMKKGLYLGILNEDVKSGLLSLYEKARYLPRNTKDILNIIYEETDAYFSGQKDKQDVIDIIQRRVQLYLAE